MKNAATTIALLAERWPKTFAVYEQRRQPLALGIHKEILAALDGAITSRELSWALRHYVSNKVYRSRLVAGAVRVGLDGQPCGEVTPEHASAAASTIQTIQRDVTHSGSKNDPKRVTGNAASPPAAVKGGSREPPPFTAPPPPPKRTSLADLRASARQRRAEMEGAGG